MSSCIFCNIVSGDLSSYNIYEDDEILAFLDAFPGTRGHTLVIPKAHYEDIFSIPDELYGKVARVGARLANILKERLSCDGITCTQLNGRASGQTVFHLHLHLLPRWYEDGIFKIWKPLTKGPEYFSELRKTILGLS